jgi:hypothetical protein
MIIINKKHFSIMVIYAIGCEYIPLKITIFSNEKHLHGRYIIIGEMLKTEKNFMKNIFINNNATYNNFIEKAKRDILNIRKKIISEYIFKYGD